MWKAVSAESTITVWTVACLAMYVAYSLILFWGKQNKLLLIPAIVQVGLAGKSIVPIKSLISVLIPLVGLILYLVYHDKAPNKAKAIGKFALIGVGICVGLYILNIALVSSMLY